MAEASHWPSGLKAIEYTQLLPSGPKGLSLGSVRISCPVDGSRRLVVSEEFSVASQYPSRLNASDWTSLMSLATVPNCLPVDTSQNLTVRSQLPEASRLPSGLKATAVTQPLWALKVRSNTKSGGCGRVRITGARIAVVTERTGDFAVSLKV